MEYFCARKHLRKDYDYTADHELRQDYYFDRLLYKLMTRFKYDGLPETIRPELLEMQLLLNGTVGIAKGQATGGLISYMGNYSNDLDGYGIGKNYIGANCIEDFDDEVGKDVVVGLNNIARLPETFFLDRYARMLGSVDESLYIQLLASRDTPVVEVNDDQEKQQYINAQKSRARGELAVFVKPTSVSQVLGTQPQSNNVLQPNNSSIIETLDNLNSMHDDLMKRFFLESGINISSKDKKAQLTVSEVDSYDDYSLINIEDAFACRKKMIDEVNSLFGLSATVELNEPFKTVVEDYEDGEVITDETTDERKDGVSNDSTVE